MPNVLEVMSTDLITLKPTDTLLKARKLMEEKRIRHIPIVDDGDKLVGLITHRDVLANSPSKLEGLTEWQQKYDEATTQLSAVMIENMAVIEPKANLRQAAIFLQKHKYGCLPVVENQRLVGIITSSDFIDVAIHLLEHLESIDPLDTDDL